MFYTHTQELIAVGMFGMAAGAIIVGIVICIATNIYFKKENKRIVISNPDMI